MIRAAVATKDGVAISEHFGHAKQFYIYAVSDDSCSLLEKRDVRHYCLGGHSDKTAMQDILSAIDDCDVIFVAKIGDGPAEKLRAKGIKAVSEYGWEEIESSLLDYLSKLPLENSVD